MKSNQQSYNSWRYIKTMFLTKPWKNAELRTFDIDTKEIWRQTETYERRKNNTKFQCSEWKKNNAFQKNLRKIQVTEHMTSTVIRLSLVLWHAWSARETRENKKNGKWGGGSLGLYETTVLSTAVPHKKSSMNHIKMSVPGPGQKFQGETAWKSRDKPCL